MVFTTIGYTKEDEKDNKWSASCVQSVLCSLRGVQGITITLKHKPPLFLERFWKPLMQALEGHLKRITLRFQRCGFAQQLFEELLANTPEGVVVNVYSGPELWERTIKWENVVRNIQSLHLSQSFASGPITQGADTALTHDGVPRKVCKLPPSVRTLSVDVDTPNCAFACNMQQTMA